MTEDRICNSQNTREEKLNKERLVLKKQHSWALVAHANNPRYSGGTAPEDPGLRSVWAKSETLSQKYPTQKK
jgi:hypothetical protein